MPRRNTLLPVLLLLMAAVFGFLRPAQAQVQGSTILVLPFQVNAGPELDYLQGGLPRLLADKLVELGFKVVPMDDMLRMLEDQQVEFIDLTTARDMALLTNADYSVYGSFAQVGESISLDVRLTDAFGMKPAKALYVTKDGVINILPAVEELAQDIRLELLSQERVVDIEVQGNIILDQDVVLLRMATQPGDIFDPVQINRDLRAIYDLGYFEDVAVAVDDVQGGKKLIVVVEEKPRIGTIGVTGNDELDEDDVLEVMTTKSGTVLNPTILAEDLERIREEYRQEGFYKAKVDFRLEGGQTGQGRLTIVVDEGPKMYIRSIEIRGAEQVKAKKVKKELALKTKGIFSFFTNSGVLDEQMLERDTAAIEAFYGNQGFLDVKVGKPEVEFADDGIHIVFNVSEGPRYKVRELGFSGDLLFEEDVLKKLVKMDELAEDSEYLDRSVLRADMEKLADFYGNYGYAFADTGLNLEKHAEDQSVSLTYVLQKNQRVRVRKLLVEGNTKTRDNVILREMRLADGDLYSNKALARSGQRLENLDFFEEVDIETIPTVQDDLLDLKVRVKEKSTGMLSAGAGYSSYSNVFFTATVQERNLFGKGYFLGFKGTFSGRETEYQLSFTNPQVYDTLFGFGVDLYLKDYEFPDFDKDTTGGRVRVGYPLGEYTRAYASYRLDKYKISDVDDDTAEEIRKLSGDDRWSSVFGLTLTRKTTNKPYLPTRGTQIDLSLSYGGGLLQGDDEFIKMIGGMDYYRTLFWKLTFHWHGEIGRVLRNFTDEEVPVFERFFLGGLSSVRGYEGSHISPRDSSSGDRVGGTKEFFTNFELIAPLVESMGIFGVLFADAGNAWAEDEHFFESGASSVDELQFGLFRSVGGGVRWLSPLGPLRLEYGIPLDDLKGSSSDGRFEFSMGTTF